MPITMIVAVRRITGAAGAALNEGHMLRADHVHDQRLRHQAHEPAGLKRRLFRNAVGAEHVPHEGVSMHICNASSPHGHRLCASGGSDSLNGVTNWSGCVLHPLTDSPLGGSISRPLIDALFLPKVYMPARPCSLSHRA